MKKYNYYLYKSEVYYEDNKKLKFISLKNPEVEISYSNLEPDEIDEFKQILPGENAQHYRTPPEKLYRVMSDLTNVVYLTEDSFINLSKQVNSYLEGIEDYERMCVMRDIKVYYYLQQKLKKAEIEDRIKHYNKVKK